MKGKKFPCIHIRFLRVNSWLPEAFHQDMKMQAHNTMWKGQTLAQNGNRILEFQAKNPRTDKEYFWQE